MRDAPRTSVNKVAILTRRHNTEAAQSLFGAGLHSDSFGPIGYVSQVSADRLKGFIGYVDGSQIQDGRINPIENRRQARFMGDVIREGISRLDNTDNTRLSIRTIVRNDMLRSFSHTVRRSGARVEATLPVMDNHSIVYVGYNVHSRELGRAMRHTHEDTIHRVRQRYESNQKELTTLADQIRQYSNQYSVRIVNGTSRSFSPDEETQICGLLSTFNYSRADARALMFNDQNIIGLVYKNVDSQQTVVGISITERRVIELTNGATVHIAEITDGTISQVDTGMSLYSRLLLNVFEHISSKNPEISLVFAETNTASDSVLKAAALEGRKFGGILPNHAIISDRQTGELGLRSLVVTYLTREQLIASARRLEDELDPRQALRNRSHTNL